MAFITESTSSLFDFLTKLDAFMVGQSWVQDQLDNSVGKAAWHKSTVYVSARWSTASPNNLGLYHALGFISTATDPGNHTDDSGNGAISGTDATLDDQRFVRITNTPVKYWAFAGSTYVHVVVQIDSGPTYKHFGFGILDKIGDWTGGEYCYGNRFYNVPNSDVAVQGASTHLLDGLLLDAGDITNAEEYAATLHCEGLPNQGGTSKWGVCMGNQSSANLGNSRSAVARIHTPGGFRAGKVARAFGRFGNNSEKALMPGYPITVEHWDRTADVAYLLGFMKDVRGVNIQYFVGGDTLVVGGDTWYLFPTEKKWISGALTATSGYQGIAYKVIP